MEKASSYQTFRARLASRLTERGAKAELCRKTGINRQTMDRWLSGEGELTLSSADKVAEALGYLTLAAMLSPESPAAARERSLAERIDELKAAVTGTQPAPSSLPDWLRDILPDLQGLGSLNQAERETLLRAIRNIEAARHALPNLRKPKGEAG